MDKKSGAVWELNMDTLDDEQPQVEGDNTATNARGIFLDMTAHARKGTDLVLACTDCGFSIEGVLLASDEEIPHAYCRLLLKTDTPCHTVPNALVVTDKHQWDAVMHVARARLELDQSEDDARTLLRELYADRHSSDDNVDAWVEAHMDDIIKERQSAEHNVDGSNSSDEEDTDYQQRHRDRRAGSSEARERERAVQREEDRAAESAHDQERVRVREEERAQERLRDKRVADERERDRTYERERERERDRVRWSS
jgi:hypothetical protein